MAAVGDDFAGQLIVQIRTFHDACVAEAGLAHDGGHGRIQVRHMAVAAGNGGTHRFAVGLTVADAGQYAARQQRKPHLPCAGQLGRDGPAKDVRAGVKQLVVFGGVRLADEARVLCAALAFGDVRPLDVQAQKLRAVRKAVPAAFKYRKGAQQLFL